MRLCPSPSNKGNEANRTYFVIIQPCLGPVHPDQVLHRIRLAHGQHHDTTDLELGQQRPGRILGGGGDDDAVKGRLIGQPEAAIDGEGR